MNFINSFISGYNINTLKLLVPIVDLSVMTIFAVIFILLSRRTRNLAYFIISITLELLTLYNIILIAIIFLESYGINPNMASILYIANNILVLITVILMPISNRSFLSDIKTINNLNNGILIVSGVMIAVLITASFLNFENFFGTAVIYGNLNNSYGVEPNGLFYLFKMYIILFVFAATLIPVIMDIFSKHNIGINSVFTIFSLIGIYLISMDIFLFKTDMGLSFDRTGLAITISYMIRFIATFSSFTMNALNSINKDNIVFSKLKGNLNILTNINEISKKLNEVDKDFMDSSMFVFEIDKENKDALDMMNLKISEILESKDKLSETKENKSQIIKDGIKFTNAVFSFFEKYKNQLQDNCKLLNGIIVRIKEADFSHSEFRRLEEDLKDIKKNLKKTSEKYIENIIEYSRQFKDISAITGEIYETIEYIKNMTNKTNLLSINAGIQSSKAGLYGKSFSVVAKEIGSLSYEISQSVESMEKILINIFSGLVMIENSAFYVEERCENMANLVKTISDEIDGYLNVIEKDINFEYANLESFETLENYNDNIFNIVEEQNKIVIYTRENINAMLDIQSSLNSKIDFQNQDIIKIFNNFNKVIETRERLNETIKKVGNYSSLSHTNIEVLSNIISSHKMKSSITFAPIISLLKSGKIR